MKSIIKLITGLSLKGKIVAAIVATTIVGGSVAGAVIISKENKDKVENNKVAASIQKESTEQISKATNQENSKVEVVKPAEQTKVEEKKEDAKESSDNKQATTENKQASSSTSANNSSTNKTTTTQKANTTNNNAGSTTKPSTPTPAPQPTPAPKPTPAPAPKPTRQSGYDDAVTRQMSQEYLSGYEDGMADPRTEVMLAAAKSIALNGVVPDNIKVSWKPYANRNTVFSYKAHSVNVEVTNDLHPYYTRWKDIPNMCDGFNCIIAYWDANLNSYKMYYVSIAMA